MVSMSAKCYLPAIVVFHYKTGRPVDWAVQFEHVNPLVVEIGSGNGDFLVKTAQEHPQKNFIAIEREHKRIAIALRKLRQAGVCNVRLLREEAAMALERLFLPSTINEFYSLFPCPWPKKKHIKHRLFSKDFFMLVNSRLIEGGRLKIVTDYEHYVVWLGEQVKDTGFRLEQKKILPTYDTKYERKWTAAGQKEFFELIFHKEKHITVPLKKDVPVITFELAEFNPLFFRMQEEHGRVRVVFKKFLWEAQAQKGLIQTIVAEENLTQHFWMSITKSGEKWKIAPVQDKKVIPTPGLNRALELIYEAARKKE